MDPNNSVMVVCYACYKNYPIPLPRWPSWSKLWLYQASNGLRYDLAVFTNGLAAQNGLDNFPCQPSSHIRALPMPIKQLLELNRECLSEVNQGQVRVRPNADSPFGRWQLKSLGNISGSQPR